MTSAIVIEGGHDIAGSVHVSGSKNGGLALMAATLLASGPSTLTNIPHVADIAAMGTLFRHLDVGVVHAHDTLKLDTSKIRNRRLPTGLTRALRASILTLGPLLGRFGGVKLALPGGCAIGARPIEEHVRGLEAMGARVKVAGGWISARAPPRGLRGAEIVMGAPSVTGTMNLVMAASLAHGVTRIRGAAREPEVGDLARCLVSMGVAIEGVGTDHLTVVGSGGVPLAPCRYRVMEDRIEAGTFLVLGALAGNPLTVRRCDAGIQTALLDCLRAIGARVEVGRDCITIRKAVRPRAIDVSTGPYPGFPTDLQPQLMALLALAEGTSRVTETVFERRFGQAGGLNAMGARVAVEGRTAVVSGVGELHGAVVAASDLRAGAALVLAAVAARGVTVIRGTEYIERGYDRLEGKLAGVGVGSTTALSRRASTSTRGDGVERKRRARMACVQG